MINKCDVLYINDNNLEYIGGEETSEKILIGGLQDRYNISVIQPGEYKNEFIKVDVYSLTDIKRVKYLIKKPIQFIAYFVRMAKTINKIQPTIIHTQSQVSFWGVSFLKRLKIISRDIVIIHTERGLFLKYNSLIQNIFFFSFKYTNILVTTTNFNKDWWKRENEKRRIELEYAVINNTAGSKFEKIDSTLVANNENIVVGFVGRYCDWKDWPLAEEICKKLEDRESTYNYIMCISCYGSTEEQKVNNMYSRIREKCGERFKGYINVPFEDIDKQYYSFDVFVLTSKKNTESFGRTIVEAMSRKTAVLTTDAGGAVEVVNDEETVCTSAEQFIEKIDYWNNNREVLENVKIRNYKRVRAKYSLNQNIDKHIELYDSIINKDLS